MELQTLANRVDRLETRVEALEALPGRMAALELQFVQFREETRLEFAATREEIRTSNEETRRLMRKGDEETRHFMRILHEDVIARLAAIREGQSGHSGPPPRATPAKRRTRSKGR